MTPIFRPRTVVEETGPKDQVVLDDLPAYDRFGLGAGEFREIPENEVKSKFSRKKTDLPPRWSETFGTLTPEEEESSFADNEKYWDELQNEEKATKFYKHIRLSRYNRRHVPNWYARRIVKLGKKGKIREAIEVFDKWMIEQDRVKPTAYEFQVLIDLLAQVGYTKKAFQLYNQMCSMRINYPNHAFTSLFNACANSPWPANGLNLANRLRTRMLVKGIRPNYITYLAMIKAFGKCGDINTAFSIADEAARLQVTDDLLNNLLVACISDKESGFRHAVMVWRKMKKFGIQPSLASYNLLVRTVNECGIGDQKLIDKLLDSTEGTSQTVKETMYLEAKHIESKTETSASEERSVEVDPEMFVDSGKNLPEPTVSSTGNMSKFQRKKSETFKEIDALLTKYDLGESQLNEISERSGNQVDELDLSDDNIVDTVVPVNENKEWWELDIFKTPVDGLTFAKEEERVDVVALPDILDPNEDFSAIVKVGPVKTKEERLALLGGVDGFLSMLLEQKITPDIVTYTQLAQVVPDYLEDRLIEEMWANGVKPDIDFYNQLIAKRARKDREGALELYRRLKLEELTPNIRTYSCLAFLCHTKEEGLVLLEEMMAAGVTPNSYTFGALLWASRYDFEYKKDVLRKMQELGIKPGVRAIELLEARIREAKALLLKYEKQRPADEKLQRKTKQFARNLNHFVSFYEKWAQYNYVEEETHPWKDFMDEPKEPTSLP